MAAINTIWFLTEEGSVRANWTLLRYLSILCHVIPFGYLVAYHARIGGNLSW